VKPTYKPWFLIEVGESVHDTGEVGLAGLESGRDTPNAWKVLCCLTGRAGERRMSSLSSSRIERTLARAEGGFVNLGTSE
jgi:hypothetical protein